MPTLSEWLLEQIDADQKYIHSPERAVYRSTLQWTSEGLDGATDRVFMDCSIHRRIVKEYLRGTELQEKMRRDGKNGDDWEYILLNGQVQSLWSIMEDLSAIYADREGYCESWIPS